MKLKRIFMLAVSVIIVSLLSCSKSQNNYGSQPSPAANGAGTYNIFNMAFPAKITVKKGATVKWFNKDGYAHTVTSDDGTTFDSGNLAAGATFSYTANTVGTFDYHCKIHSNMNGTLVVTE
ncbi:MAG: cupredoxin domain-containing protein [Ginsengibacter sp.]